jgi:hypothetical protein
MRGPDLPLLQAPPKRARDGVWLTAPLCKLSVNEHWLACGSPLPGGLLELLGVDLEDAREDDVVDHEEGDDHEGREHQDVPERLVVVRLPTPRPHTRSNTPLRRFEIIGLIDVLARNEN